MIENLEMAVQLSYRNPNASTQLHHSMVSLNHSTDVLAALQSTPSPIYTTIMHYGWLKHHSRIASAIAIKSYSPIRKIACIYPLLY